MDVVAEWQAPAGNFVRVRFPEVSHVFCKGKSNLRPVHVREDDRLTFVLSQTSHAERVAVRSPF